MIWVPGALLCFAILAWMLPDRYLRAVVCVSIAFLGACLISEWTRWWQAPDALASWFFRVVVIISISVIWYSEPYIRREAEHHGWPASRLGQYFGLLLVFVASLMAVSLWTSFLFLWVDMEIVTLSSVVLVGIEADARSIEAAWRFLIVTEAGGMLSLLGTVIALVNRSTP